MYSKTCKFSRSVNSTVSSVLRVVGFSSAILGIIIGFAGIVVYRDETTKLIPMIPTLIGLFVGYFACLILAAVGESVIVPDFSYTIRIDKEETFMVFEFSEADYRILKINFEITSKNRKYMTLDDGCARIRIAYDKSVAEFLNGVKK